MNLRQHTANDLADCLGGIGVLTCADALVLGSQRVAELLERNPSSIEAEFALTAIERAIQENCDAAWLRYRTPLKAFPRTYADIRQASVATLLPTKQFADYRDLPFVARGVTIGKALEPRFQRRFISEGDVIKFMRFVESDVRPAVTTFNAAALSLRQAAYVKSAAEVTARWSEDGSSIG